MKYKALIVADLFLLFSVISLDVTASGTSVKALRAPATACSAADDQTGLQRSVFRLTNYGASTIHIFCPIQFPELYTASNSVRVDFYINDQDASSNTNCYLSVRRQDGSEVTGSAASTAGVGLQMIQMSVLSSTWDANFDYGNLGASFVLECWLPKNNGSDYTRMHSYSVTNLY